MTKRIRRWFRRVILRRKPRSYQNAVLDLEPIAYWPLIEDVVAIDDLAPITDEQWAALGPEYVCEENDDE